METKVYLVPLIIDGQIHEFLCYSLDDIYCVADLPKKESYGELCKSFGIKQSEVIQPKRIYLLISMRQNLLHPVPLKTSLQRETIPSPQLPLMEVTIQTRTS